MISKILIGAAMGMAVAALPMTNAAAEIVCSGDTCWHTHERYEYPADARIVVHPDNWRWGSSEHYTWREHEGRGYWRDQRWIER
jgi:hypothetical protein